MPDSSISHRLAVNASWLLRLRWVAVVGQVTAIGIACWPLQLELQLLPLLAIVTLTGITNLAFAMVTRRLRRFEESTPNTPLLLSTVMFLDLLLLTGLLYFTGGPENPFVLFYLVNIALAAVLLRPRWSWALGVVAVACFALLHVQHQPVLIAGIEASMAKRADGFFIALVSCVLVVTYFITRVSSELQHRESQLRLAQDQQARTERLEGLATLAAGAAHELATPLSTIAVVATELEHHLDGTQAPAEVLEDVSLIRTELARCRTILNRMSADAGQVAGDELRRVRLDEVIESAVQGLPPHSRVEVEYCTGKDASVCVVAPLQGLAQAIRSLLQNACDASPANKVVKLTASAADGRVEIRVVDQGTGMPKDVLRRVGEPFFTTKEPGVGTGLGVFLTRSVLERLGGTLQFESETGQGTTAIVTLNENIA